MNDDLPSWAQLPHINKKVLIVEADEGNRAGAMHEDAEVRKYGYEFVVVSSVENALHVLKRQRIFGVIVDGDLPNALAVVNKAMSKPIRAIVVGYGNEETESQIRQC